MENQNTVIKFWHENGETHYIISEGTSKITGEEKKIGRKVRFITGTGEYLCSCSHPAFARQQEDCSHITALKYLQDELNAKGQEIVPEKKERIEDLKDKIQELEALREVQAHEQEALGNQIRTYQSELGTATERTGMLEGRIQELEALRREQLNENEALNSDLEDIKGEYKAIEETKKRLEGNIADVEREKNTITAQLNQTIGEKEGKIHDLSLKEEELSLTIEILKEKLEETKREKYAAQTIIDGFKQAKYATPPAGIPPGFEDFAAAISAIPEEVLLERLCDDIYSNIPDSDRENKDKVQIGTCEHGEPKLFKEFITKLSSFGKVYQINSSFQCSDKTTRIKGVYAPGDMLPSSQKTDAWTVHMVYSNHGKSTNLYLKTTARNKVEARAVAQFIEKSI